MELTLPATEQCRVSAETVGASANPSLAVFYPEILAEGIEGGAWLDQVSGAPGGSAAANRVIFFVRDRPPLVQQQSVFWLLSEGTEEAAPEPPRLADPSQESIRFNPVSPVGTWIGEVSERFDYLLSLPTGWDGHQAAPIKSEHILAAARFLSAVMAPETAAPAIVPTADGGAQLEWHQGGVDVEVLFSDSEDVALYVHDLASGNEWEGAAIEGFSEFDLASRLGT